MRLLFFFKKGYLEVNMINMHDCFFSYIQIVIPVEVSPNQDLWQIKKQDNVHRLRCLVFVSWSARIQKSNHNREIHTTGNTYTHTHTKKHEIYICIWNTDVFSSPVFQGYYNQWFTVNRRPLLFSIHDTGSCSEHYKILTQYTFVFFWLHWKLSTGEYLHHKENLSLD